MFASTARAGRFRRSTRYRALKKFPIHMLAHRLCTRRSALCTGYPQRCKTRRFVRCPAGANVAETSLPGHVGKDRQSHWNPCFGVAADGACPVDNLWTASPATRALRGIVGARWYLFSKRRNSTADVRADGTRHKRRSPCTGAVVTMEDGSFVSYAPGRNRGHTRIRGQP
jgi:hypothetical protein